jgi:hypothetical protein
MYLFVTIRGIISGVHPLYVYHTAKQPKNNNRKVHSSAEESSPGNSEGEGTHTMEECRD